MRSKWFLAAITVLLITLVALVGFVQHDAVVAAQDGSEKIEALLLDNFATNGFADFFIIMSEQADVTAAVQLPTKFEKGQYVFDTLLSTANRTQSEVKVYLDGQNVNYTSFYIVNSIFIKGGDINLAMEMATRPDVSQITANHTYQLDIPIITPSAPDEPTGIEPNIQFVNAPDVWAMGITGQGMVVAGNDTGLDETHPAIKARYRGCVDPPTCSSYDNNYNWWDATGTYPTDPWDGFGHGTHTTGTMMGDDGGENQIGMAPGAQTIHCKNMTDGGNGDDNTFLTCFEWDLAPWDLNHQDPRSDLAPDAINNSWGYGGGGQNQFRTAIDNLQAAGIVVEVSAGNEGSSCSTLRSPGDYLEVLTTGSVNHANPYPGTLTGFSSRGPSNLDGDYFPDIMAPGENIRSSVPGGGYEGGWSGTSMAGPHATGLIALIWSANPALRGQVDTTYNIIRDTATPLTGQNGSNCGGDYTLGPNNDWGFGTIDALAAVQQAIAMGGAGKLDGTVTDIDTGDPIQGVNINALSDAGYSWDVLTDASGYYTMTVAVGTFTVEASKYGYSTEAVYPVVVITDTVTSQDFALTSLPNYIISGHVYDADTGDPLDATVEFTDAPVVPVTTDPDGFYSLTVAEGTWTMLASAISYQSEQLVVDVTGDMTVDFYLNFQQEWIQLSQLPPGCPDFTRFDAEYYPGDGMVYILGGRGGSDGGSTFGDVYAYDPVGNLCTDTGVDMPTPVSNYTIVLVNDGSADQLCIFGGRDSAGGYTASYQCYDPVANSAATLGTLPGDLPGYIPGGMGVYDNKVYVFAGFRNTTTPYHTAQTWEWDPVTDAWTQKGDVTIGRGYINVAVVDGLIYGFGGDVFDGTNLNAQTIAEVFDPATGLWDDAAVADMPSATGEGRAFGFDTSSPYDQAGKIIIAGGGLWPADTFEAFSYDIVTDTYDYSFPDLDQSMRNQAGFFVPGDPGAMWVFGGRSGVDTPPYALPEFYIVNLVIPQPNIKVEAPLLEVVLPPDDITTLDVIIKNIGQLPLDWTLSELPTVDWLDEAPTDGTINPGDPETTVAVNFDSIGLAPGVFETDLLIESNDPDTPLITLPVMLTVKPLADLSINKTDSPDPVFAGHPLTYTLEVNNLGPEDAPSVVVTDDLPANVTFDYASEGCTPSGQVVTCDVGELASGNSVTLAIVVITPSTAGQISNTATVDGNVVDPVAENNTSSTVTSVEIEPADLQVIMGVSPSPVRLGEVLTYTLYVSNLGTGDATGVKVVDNLPTGVTFDHASPGCGRIGLKVTCNIGALGAGDVLKLYIVVHAPIIEETITNTVTVSANEPDPDPDNNTTTIETMVIPLINKFYLPVIRR